MPALRGLAREHPDHDLVLAAPRALAPLVEATGAVAEHADVAPLAPLPDHLAGCEIAVNLHGSGPQSHRLLLAANPGRLVAFAHLDVPESAGGPAWREDEHEVARWCRLAGGDPVDLDLVMEPADDLAGATVVHPGAALAAKRWPAECWGAVARAEHDAGRRVVITGGPQERELAERVAVLAGLGPACVLAGRTDLAGLAAVVASAARVVSSDTGVAHLATALGRPSVVLFAPESPARWGPPSDRSWHRVLWHGDTRPPAAPGAPAPGLLAVQVEEVLDALSALPEPRFAPMGVG